MPISFSQRVELQCPECSARFSVEVWLIVDAGERPDLAARCRDGTLHDVTCPNGHTATLGAPLLYHDRAREQLILAVPPNTDEQHARAIHAQLLPRLQANLLAPFPAYLNQTQVVPQELLPALLSDDPEAALAEQLARNLPPLLRTLQEFIQADSWDASQTILAQHPELLSDEADLLLAQLIDAAREQKDARAEKMFAEHRDVLQRARRDRRAMESHGSTDASRVNSADADDASRLEPTSTSASRRFESAADLAALLQEIARLTRLSEMPRKVELCEQALRVAKREDNPQLWGALQNDIANALAQNPLGNRADNLEQAIAHYELALHVYTRDAFPTDWAMTQNNLANAYLYRIRGERAENLARAIEYYQNALQIHTPQAYPSDACRTARNLGNLYSEIQKWNEARSAYAIALTAAEQLFRHAVDPTTQRAEAAELANLYDRDIRACVALCQSPISNLQSPIDALVSAEAARSRAFLKQMGQGDYAAPAEIPPPLREREARLREQMRQNEIALAHINTRSDRASETERALVAQRRELTQQLEAVWDEMLAPSPASGGGQGGGAAREYVALRRGETPTWDDLRALAQRIGPDAALVEFHTLADQIIAFVWRAGWDAPQLVALPLDRARLVYRYLLPYEQEVLRHSYHVSAQREIHNDWLALGEELLAPLVDRRSDGRRSDGRRSDGTSLLGDASLVYFIPHGALHLVPLHALTVHGKPFIEERAVAYAPSAAVLARAIDLSGFQNLTGLPSALVMGYALQEEERPTFIGEAEEVAKLFGVAPLVDNAATKNVITQHAPRSALIHLSCHGLFNTQDALASAVLLADGEFTAREWMRLRLDADLVTLSACQLAFSQTNPGDDLVGMARALFYAGASSVLLALWSVQSDTTKAWMVDFYKRVWRAGIKQQPLAFAHRAATLELMRAYPHEPHIWAPFVLMGNWD